jgi:hypothetical protein
MGCVIPVTCGRKEEMSQWSNDAPEHKRLCPFREKNYCAATFAIAFKKRIF